MSLDFYLIDENKKVKKEGSGIFIRENGMTKEITKEEWNEKFPEKEPVVVTNDFDDDDNEVFHANITHNLGKMAQAAGIYECLWRPIENGYTKAIDIIDRLKTGIELMKSNPEYFKSFDAENGWGTYKDFLPWLKNLLNACIFNPDATIDVSV